MYPSVRDFNFIPSPVGRISNRRITSYSLCFEKITLALGTLEKTKPRNETNWKTSPLAPTGSEGSLDQGGSSGMKRRGDF